MHRNNSTVLSVISTVTIVVRQRLVTKLISSSSWQTFAIRRQKKASPERETVIHGALPCSEVGSKTHAVSGD